MGVKILLDSDEFQTAINEFSELNANLGNLITDIENAIDDLESGFQTEAGKKYINLCQNSLIKNLKEQQSVFNHVSENLRSANKEYQSVFEEFKALNNQK